MFKHVSMVLVLTLMIAVFLPSYAVMGMENEVKNPPIFIPKEMASEDELLEEDFIEDQQSDTENHAILIMFSKPTKLQKCNWIGTMLPSVIGYVAVTPPVKIISFGLSVTAPPICEYLFD